MLDKRTTKLDRRTKYLQVALNNTLDDARAIISLLPRDPRVLLEAGTPLIKRYGIEGIRKIVAEYTNHISTDATERNSNKPSKSPLPYVVADLKMMDRGETEVRLAARAGASAATALGCAPIESLDSFIDACAMNDMDSMVDMMNVEFPISILTRLRRQPDVVILHRGVDETEKNREKMLPLHEIRRIKGTYGVLIAIAGGDSVRELQSAVFNDADIVVVWKDFYSSDTSTAFMASEFLRVVS